MREMGGKPRGDVSVSGNPFANRARRDAGPSTNRRDVRRVMHQGWKPERAETASAPFTTARRRRRKLSA